MRRLLPVSFLSLASVLLASVTSAQEVPKDMGDTIARAVEILLERQESDEHMELGVNEPVPDDQDLEDRREWPYQGVYRVGGKIPWGYRIGGTSIACRALMDAPGFEKNKRAKAAVDRGQEFVLEALDEELMQPGFERGYDVRGWGHTYALDFLLARRKRGQVAKSQVTAINERIAWLVETLSGSMLTNGGWNYSRRSGDKSAASPFMTGPTLLALYEAQAQGEAVDPVIVNTSLDGLEKSRGQDGSYPYTARKSKRDTMPGSTGRTPVIEVALQLAGRGDQARLRNSIEGFFENWQFLEDRRGKDRTHLPPYGIAPYYFFYAHRYVAMAIEFLPEAERPALRARFYERLFQVQEESGGWNDRVFDRSENYGTACSLMALLEPTLPRPTAWSGAAQMKKKRSYPSKKQKSQSAVATSPAFQRVHVLGASVSEGFGTKKDFGKNVSIGNVLTHVLGQGTKVTESASGYFFLDPVGTGKSQVEAAKSAKATMLFGVDFLFWYAYGSRMNGDQRVERLETGLAELAKFEGPIVVGDIPHVEYALEGGMLMASQLPTLEDTQRCNHVLRKWARERGDVHIVPLAEFLEGIPDKETVRVHGKLYEDPFLEFYQDDLLHANVPGTIAVTYLALDAVPKVDELAPIEWRDEVIFERLGGKPVATSKPDGKPVPAGVR